MRCTAPTLTATRTVTLADMATHKIQLLFEYAHKYRDVLIVAKRRGNHEYVLSIDYVGGLSDGPVTLYSSYDHKAFWAMDTIVRNLLPLISPPPVTHYEPIRSDTEWCAFPVELNPAKTMWYRAQNADGSVNVVRPEPMKRVLTIERDIQHTPAQAPVTPFTTTYTATAPGFAVRGAVSMTGGAR